MDDRDGFDRFDPRFDYKYPTSSKTSPNKKTPPGNYEGVEYIPSERPPQGRGPQGRGPQGRGPQGGGRYPPRGYGGQGGAPPASDKYAKYYNKSASGKRKVKSQSQSSLYMALIIGVGVLFCFAAFYAMYTLFNRESPVRPPEPETAGQVSQGDAAPQREDTDIAAGEFAEADASLAGIIAKISNGTLTLVSAEDDDFYDIYVNAQTQYKNRYGQPMTLSQLQEGDIVIADYDSINKKAGLVRLDPEAWVKASIKNVEINLTTSSVKVANDTLGVSKNVLFLPDGTEPSVKTSDTVTLKGRKSKIMAVIVEKRTGTLEFKNKDKITDGTVEVDSDIYKALEEVGSLRVPTGAHTVVIKGANIEIFIKEIDIAEGETLVIDLEEAQMKEGVIDLSVNVPDYSLSVNDEPVLRSSEPLKLPFGAYKLKVSKEGYTPWEGNVTVNQPSVAVTATLAEEVKMGKITITTEPEYVNGSVYIDNAMIGVAPIYRVNVTYGSHTLTVKAPGYLDTSVPIIVEGDVSYNVRMHPVTDTGTGADTGLGSDNTGIPPDTGTGEEPPGVMEGQPVEW